MRRIDSVFPIRFFRSRGQNPQKEKKATAARSIHNIYVDSSAPVSVHRNSGNYGATRRQTCSRICEDGFPFPGSFTATRSSGSFRSQKSAPAIVGLSWRSVLFVVYSQQTVHRERIVKFSESCDRKTASATVPLFEVFLQLVYCFFPPGVSVQLSNIRN